MKKNIPLIILAIACIVAGLFLAMDTPLRYWYAKKEEKECKQDILDMTQNYPQIAFDVLPDLRRGRSVLLKPELFVEASDNL